MICQISTSFLPTAKEVKLPSTSIQFTLVDTSLFQGAGQLKVGELRSLPAETTTLSAPSNLSCESEEDTSDDEGDEDEENNTASTAVNMTDMGVCVDSSDCANSILKYYA